ncbi:DNA damage-binding protein 1a [Phlyctochytrium planicorne]|nr:DNA damage-binding protein 1a [Phlyctochytrium planicorne]
MQYIATAKKADSVTKCIAGPATDDIPELIVCKSNHVEIYKVEDTRLRLLMDHEMFCPIADIQLIYDKQGSQETQLFVLTERNDYCVYNLVPGSTTLPLVTRGDVKDLTGFDSTKCIFDPHHRFTALLVSEKKIKIISKFGQPLNLRKSSGSSTFLKRKVSEVDLASHLFSVQLMENIAFVCILDAPKESKPVFAILHSDSKGQKFIELYDLNINDEELAPRSGRISVDPTAHSILYLPDGGFTLVGDATITKFSVAGKALDSLESGAAIVSSAKNLDNPAEFFLGDSEGKLYLLRTDGKLDLLELGETSIPSSLVSLGKSLLFVGSHYGDSQLVNCTIDEISTINAFDVSVNLAPIVDFCVIDNDKQGQSQIVACSGALKHGALRLIRNGIGIQEIAEMEVGGIQGLWSFKSNAASGDDDVLLLSFFGESKLLGFDEEGEIAELETEIRTDVTNAELILYDKTTLSEKSKWVSPSRINHVCVKDGQVLLGLGGGLLVYIEITELDVLEVKTETHLPHEIACLGMGSTSDNLSTYCIVGLWTEISFRLLQLPTLAPMQTYLLGGDILPRSALSISLDDVDYIFIGLGDGQLCTFTVEKTTGHLELIEIGGKTNAFVSCDRPTIIYPGANNKLVYSNVNLKDVVGVCPFSMASFPGAIAIATATTLTIGLIDDVQRLHIRTIPIGENPRRIAYNLTEKTFAVLTTQFLSPEQERSFVKLYDEQTFECENATLIET